MEGVLEGSEFESDKIVWKTLKTLMQEVVCKGEI